MSRPYFYNETTKKIIVAFASLFDEITVDDDFGRPYRVPLIFSQKEKFIEAANVQNTDPVIDQTTFDITFPRMGFELLGIQYDPQRQLNPLNQMIETTDDNDDIISFDRTPYNFEFNLYIGARKLEDSLKIVEQIVPYFTPELTVTIKDREDFKLETNIPFVLNSTNLDLEYEGSFNQRRVIIWTLSFTGRGFYYPIKGKTNRIKQTIMEFGDFDFKTKFEKLTSTVVPIDANKDDPHTIVDTRESINE